jgi:hypothetical protein
MATVMLYLPKGRSYIKTVFGTRWDSGQNLADTSSLFLCKFLVGRTDLGWTLTEGGTVSTGYVGGFGVVDCPTANVGSNICGGTSTKSGRNHNLFQLVMRVGLGRGGFI